MFCKNTIFLVKTANLNIDDEFKMIFDADFADYFMFWAHPGIVKIRGGYPWV